jgi:hypothetical protein
VQVDGDLDAVQLDRQRRHLGDIDDTVDGIGERHERREVSWRGEHPLVVGKGPRQRP